MFKNEEAFVFLVHMALATKKPVFSGVRTTKAQTSLRIRAV